LKIALIGLDHRFGHIRTTGKPRQGIFGKPGKLFERERVLAGLSKDALAWL
jgi:hypothetical protein